MPKTFVEGPQGKPMAIEPEMAQTYSENALGSAGVIAPEHASRLAQQESARNFAEDTFGGPGLAALGVGQGIGLNLPGMGAMALSDYLGDTNRSENIRRLLMGASQSGAYGAGEAAGTFLPALAGDEAGILGLAGGGAERLAGAILPEVPGLLGTAGRGAVKLAARGSAEGALINVANEANQSLIYNHPLTFDALAARSLDGALLGGLAGVTVGGIGAVLGHAVEKGGRLVANSFEKTASPVAADVTSKYADVLGSQGAKLSDSPAKIMSAARKATEDFDKIRAGVISKLDTDAAAMAPNALRVGARLAAEDDELSPKLIKKLETTPLYEIDPVDFTKPPPLRPKLEEPPPKPTMGEPMDVLDPGGKPQARIPLNKKQNPISAAYEAKRLGKEITEFDKRAASGEAAGAWNKANERLHENNMKKWASEVEAVNLRNSEAVKSWKAERKVWKEDLESSKSKPAVIKHLGDEGGGTWSQWIGLRDRLAAGNRSQRAAASIIDSEIRSAMEGAEARIGVKGLADQYAHATVSRKMAEELSGVASTSHKAGRKIITPQELMYGGIWAAKGRVGSALAHMAARQGGKAVESIMGGAKQAIPQNVGEAVLRNASAARAAANVRDVSLKLSKIVRTFFGTARARGANLAISKERQNHMQYTRDGYDKNAASIEELLSEQHAARVNDYAGTDLANISPDLAKAAVDGYSRAAQYISVNQPPSHKSQQAGSLRKQPVSKQLSMDEFKFLRISNAIRDPIKTLEKISTNSLSRDEAGAIKSVYPELHGILVSTVQNEIVNMKNEGKDLSVGKIASLGLLLGAPVDRILEPDYIAETQKALHTPTMEDQGTNNGTNGQPTGNMNSGPIGQAQQQLLTPIDKAVLV